MNTYLEMIEKFQADGYVTDSVWNVYGDKLNSVTVERNGRDVLYLLTETDQSDGILEIHTGKRWVEMSAKGLTPATVLQFFETIRRLEETCPS